jgi:hypothetical protein
LLRLATGAENKVNDDIKFHSAEFGLMVLEKLAVAENFFSALRCIGLAAMKNCDMMAALLKLLGREASDETTAADKKDIHDCSFSGPKAHIFKLDLRGPGRALFHH